MVSYLHSIATMDYLQPFQHKNMTDRHRTSYAALLHGTEWQKLWKTCINSMISNIKQHTLCLKKTCDHVFDDKLN